TGPVAERWKVAVPGVLDVAMSDEHVFAWGTGDKLTALDRASGDIVWSAQVGEVGTVSVTQRGLVVAGDAGLRLLDEDTGDEIWLSSGVGTVSNVDALTADVAVVDLFDSDVDEEALDLRTGKVASLPEDIRVVDDGLVRYDGGSARFGYDP